MRSINIRLILATAIIFGLLGLVAERNYRADLARDAKKNTPFHSTLEYSSVSPR